MKSSFLLAVASLPCILYNVSCGQVHSQSPSSDPKLDSIGAVSWNAIGGNKFYGKDPNEIYVYVSVKGNETQNEKKRVPLNISIVLDRSGSMSGEKIAYAKRAAGFVLDQLTSEDILSIVNYDDVVEVTSPSAPIQNKEVLHKKIDALFDRGSTNLTGGMLEGFAQVKSTKKEGYVNRVLLLTDGLANVGITEPTEMKKLVEKKYMEEGIALSTFGLGADYNEDLLTMLAEIGRANYYFIGSPDKIPGIFASELKGLLSVVAQNAYVEVNVPQNLECVKVYGFPYEVKNNVVTIRFNDIYSRDQKSILLKFKKKSNVSDDLAFNCTLKFTEANTFDPVRSHKKVQFSYNDNLSAIEESKDHTVEEMIALYESADMFDDIMAEVDRGNYDSARVRAEKAVTYLKSKQQTIKSEKLKKQEESLTVYSKDINKVKEMRDEEKKIYQKSNKMFNYSTKKGKN